MTINFAGEGPTDAALLRRLIVHCGGVPGTDYTTSRRGRGKQNIDARLVGFNRAAHHARSKTIILRDLDMDAGCAPTLISRLIDNRDQRLCLRIAVRQAEAWLLADSSNIAKTLRINIKSLPMHPELLNSPKASMIALARKSTSADVRRAILPQPRSGIPVGPGYAATLLEFIDRYWDIDSAIESGKAPSLDRAVMRLKQLIALP